MRDTNRVSHIAWAVRPENIEKYAAQLSELFQTEFRDVTSERAGVRAFISWEAGLELAAPINDGIAGQVVTGILNEKGEGACALIFRVPDLEAATVHAEALGWPVDRTEMVPEDGLLPPEKITYAEERYVGPFLDTTLLFIESEFTHEFLNRDQTVGTAAKP